MTVKAKTSPTKWHSKPYGFEIIGSERIKTKKNPKRPGPEPIFFSYTDALRTIHLTCRESVTVSSCLADNMAKGIHLNRPTTTKTQIRGKARLVAKAASIHLWQDKSKQTVITIIMIITVTKIKVYIQRRIKESRSWSCGER